MRIRLKNLISGLRMISFLLRNAIMKLIQHDYKQLNIVDLVNSSNFSNLINTK